MFHVVLVPFAERIIKMKILFIINSLCGGGAEKLIRDIVLIMRKSCYCEVMLLTNNGDKYSNDLTKNDVIVKKIDAKTKIGTIIFLHKYIVNNDFDIVHANLFPSNYFCAFAKLVNRKKFPILVTTEHNTDNRRRHFKILRYLEKIIYSVYDHVISISEETEISLLKWLNEVPNERFSVIFNGVDIDFFQQAKPYKRKELCDSIEEDDIILGLVGSFTKQKNHEYMLNIMKKIPNNYKLLLVI